MFELPEKIVFMCSQLLLFCFKARTCQVDRKREEFVRNSVKLIFCRLQVSSGVSLNNSVNIKPCPMFTYPCHSHTTLVWLESFRILFSDFCGLYLPENNYGLLILQNFLKIWKHSLGSCKEAKGMQ